MSMNTLEKYIDPAFVYRFTQGPDVVGGEIDARERGINCISLAHIALRELFESDLPSTMNCYEMYIDDTRFSTVETVDTMQKGDLAWFGSAHPRVAIEDFVPEYSETGYLLNWRDRAVNHVAIYTGEVSDGEYQMLHSTPIEGTNVMWPLSRFAEYARYEKLYKISRLRTEPVDLAMSA